MLTLLRSAAGTWIAKILLGLLILSFGVWGITGASFNFASGSLATVGTVTIKTADFQREYFAEINRVGQQIGRRLTTAQARQFGLDRQVLARMLNQASLDDRTDAFSLGISEDRLAETILKDPIFQDAKGDFDSFRYQQLVRSVGLSEDLFLASQRRAYERQQIVDTLIADIAIPKVLSDAIKTHASEERTIDYIEIDVRDIDPVQNPENAALDTYFMDNKSTYRAPEYRSLQYFALQGADLGNADKVTDADARTYYNASKARYTTVEKRAIRRINFETEAKARDALEKIKAGSSFDDLMTQLKLTNGDVNLGTFEKTGILDKRLAEAAFNLPEKTPSDLVNGDFGKMIVYIDTIKGGSTQSFKDVSASIKSELAAEANNRELIEKLDLIEDDRAGGSTMREIAAKFSLKLITVKDVALSGVLSAGGEISDKTPALNKLLDEAFASDTGIENDVIEIGRDGFLWFEVTDLKPARDRTITEVKAQVKSDWIEAETTKAVKLLSEELVASLSQGKTMKALAEELGRPVGHADNVRRNAVVDGLSSSAVAIAFKGPKGFVTTANGERNNQAFVLQVAEIITPQVNRADKQAEETLISELQNDILGTYIEMIREREGSSINVEAVNYATDIEGQQGHGGRNGYGG